MTGILFFTDILQTKRVAKSDVLGVEHPLSLLLLAVFKPELYRVNTKKCFGFFFFLIKRVVMYRGALGAPQALSQGTAPWPLRKKKYIFTIILPKLSNN